MVFFMRLALVCLMVSVFPRGVWAQTNPDSTLVLDAYLNEVLLRNPAYQAAVQRWQAAQAEVDVAGGYPDPTLVAGIFMIQEVETRVGPQEQRVMLGQRIPWPGKLALAAERAQHTADSAQRRVAAQALELTTQFKNLYADYYLVGQSIAITADHLELMRNLENVVSDKYQTNMATYNDLIRVQMEIDKMGNRLATHRERARPIAAAMNALLGRAGDEPIPFPAALPMPPDPDMPASTNALNDRLDQFNPILGEMDHQIAADRTAVALAKKNHRPDFQISLDWIRTGEALNPAMPDSGKDPLMLSVGLNLPIWRKKYRAADVAAAARLDATIYQRRNMRLKLEAGMQQALFQKSDAERRIVLYRDQIIPKAKESLDVSLTGFQNGKTNYRDLIEAEQALLEFQLSLNQAQTDLVKAAAAIEGILGETNIDTITRKTQPQTAVKE